MSFKYQMAFWSFIILALTLLFGHTAGGYSTAFFFVCMLLPVAVGTSWFFNEVLVPRYLMTQQYVRFSLYFVYSMIISLWAQMIVILLAFVILANLQIENISPLVMNVRLLALTVYGIVFLQAFLHMYLKFSEAQQQADALSEEQRKADMGHIVIQANRRKQHIALASITYIESRADYVLIMLSDKSSVRTRETISKIQQCLPKNFIRIHRSFIVRKEAIRSFNREEVTLVDVSLPIGRKYKDMFSERLQL